MSYINAVTSTPGYIWHVVGASYVHILVFTCQPKESPCLGTRLSTIVVSTLSALVSFQLKQSLPPIGYTTANQNRVATAPAAASHTSAESPALIFEYWILVGRRFSGALGTPINAH